MEAPHLTSVKPLMKLEISILGSMEAWLYWRKYSYKDNKAIKGLVLFVLFCDTVQMAMLTESGSIAGECGDYFSDNDVPYIPGAGAARLGDLSPRISSRLTAESKAITDVAISVAMVGYLYSSKTGFRRSNDMINRLIVFTFNTGIPVSLSALLAFISINVWRGTFIYMFFFLMLYTNSLLVTLNTREHIRDASNSLTTSNERSQPGATSRSGDFYTMGRFTEPAEGDPATPGPFTPGLSPRSAKHQSNPNSPIAIQIDTTRQNFVDGASEDNYPDKKGHESV
ncbi:hypothetical protein WG66_000999 [Moniliophthora roreri]|nr:hypothetical protein WG66_000999 [Moniliophthora roreri]